MNRLLTLAAGAILFALGVHAAPQTSAPIYRVNVVSRTLPAVNYQHLGGPTEIGFQGTVLLPRAKGDATVESRRGRTSIQAKFERLPAPSRFGAEYLTYVLWAITPEGRPKNLGELVVNPSDKARIEVSTDLQALGMMVTAEPYYAVSQPSDVVVLENVVRPGTIGKREVVTAKYDLLPRGQYTLTLHPGEQTNAASRQKLSWDRYEALLEVYQAQNAVQIAQSVGADRDAADTFQKAQRLLTEAQNMEASGRDTNTIVSTAREAAQMAEDARTLAAHRREEIRVSKLQEEAAAARKAREQAEAEAQQQRARAETAQAEAEAQRAAAEQAQADAAHSQALAAQREREVRAAATEVVTAKQAQADSAKRQSRAVLLNQLNAILPTRDTPRGILITVPDSMVGRTGLAQKLDRVAGVLSSRPGLSARVEGYASGIEASRQDAEAVRDDLVAGGMRPDSVTAAGYGDARPLASNATAEGREQNRRVEIVIAGEPIGNMALWDRAYSIGER